MFGPMGKGIRASCHGKQGQPAVLMAAGCQASLPLNAPLSPRQLEGRGERAGPGAAQGRSSKSAGPPESSPSPADKMQLGKLLTVLCCAKALEPWGGGGGLEPLNPANGGSVVHCGHTWLRRVANCTFHSLKPSPPCCLAHSASQGSANSANLKAPWSLPGLSCRRKRRGSTRESHQIRTLKLD